MSQWSGILEVPAEGDQEMHPIRVPLEDGKVPEKPRFVLFQTNLKGVTTMWTLWDTKTERQHLLYGRDWDEAQAAANIHIQVVRGLFHNPSPESIVSFIKEHPGCIKALFDSDDPDDPVILDESVLLNPDDWKDVSESYGVPGSLTERYWENWSEALIYADGIRCCWAPDQCPTFEGV